MAQQLKRWESPRRQGRNAKGKGGSARQRQLRKQQQILRQKLKPNTKHRQPEREETSASSFFFALICGCTKKFLIKKFLGAAVILIDTVGIADRRRFTPAILQLEFQDSPRRWATDESPWECVIAG
jgi:hypothetical protein